MREWVNRANTPRGESDCFLKFVYINMSYFYGFVSRSSWSGEGERENERHGEMVVVLVVVVDFSLRVCVSCYVVGWGER